jgi:Ankyrin repeats (many copies)
MPKRRNTRLSNLGTAILRDDRVRVKQLLKEHPDLIAQASSTSILAKAIPHWIYPGDTALHIAAMAHRPEMAELLLKAGADARSVSWYRNAQPLHYAADGYVSGKSYNAKRQVQTISVLLKAGADVHARDKNGATPLHRAVRTRCAAAVECLLDAGADPAAKNKPGSTAFHLAVQNTGHGGSGSAIAKAAQRRIIEAFIRKGARTALKDAKGHSVLDQAQSDWIRDILNGKSA